MIHSQPPIEPCIAAKVTKELNEVKQEVAAHQPRPAGPRNWKAYARVLNRTTDEYGRQR